MCLRILASAPDPSRNRITVILVTLLFVRSWEPSRVITKPIPTPNVRLLIGGGFAVISDWDETAPAFEDHSLLRKPERISKAGEINLGNHVERYDKGRDVGPIASRGRARGRRRNADRSHSRQGGRPGIDLQLQRHRSEEHTSELQSLRHLVCRLLLEKKKK